MISTSFADRPSRPNDYAQKGNSMGFDDTMIFPEGYVVDKA